LSAEKRYPVVDGHQITAFIVEEENEGFLPAGSGDDLGLQYRRGAGRFGDAACGLHGGELFKQLLPPGRFGCGFRIGIAVCVGILSCRFDDVRGVLP